MAKIDMMPRAVKFIKTLPPKHKRQIKDHILSLINIPPHPADSKTLQGYDGYRRTDIGEYRVIYQYDKKKDLVMIVVVGRRNDDSVYRIAKRILK